MIYYMYQITNNVNGKIYVGVHKTKSLDDGYIGSGKIIRRAFIKHGIMNFSKDILEYFEDSKSMYAREKEVVNEEFLLREDVYNLRIGGYGGFEYINKSLTSEDYSSRGKLGQLKGGKLFSKEYNPTALAHTETAKIKRNLTSNINCTSNTFKRWVTDGVTNRYINIKEVDDFLIRNLSFKFGKIQRK